jgi:YjbE family integral membrane protein
MTSSTLGALAEVLLVNLVLSGDNAVVIGLAARGLTGKSRNRAIILGGVFAVVLRLALTLPAEFLLSVPLLRAGGGVLLAWVAYRLLTTDSGNSASGEADTVAAAIRLIVLADLTMSLDNILAVAAVAEKSDHDVLVLVVGLALSIPIVLLGGGLVARFMARLPILVWIGAAVLGFTAGQLIADDKALDTLVDKLPHGSIVIPTVLAIGIVVLSLARMVWLRRNDHRRSEAPTLRHSAD